MMVIPHFGPTWLSGGDWNHGMDYDFPETVGNGIIIPTDQLIFFRGVAKNHQPATY